MMDQDEKKQEPDQLQLIVEASRAKTSVKKRKLEAVGAPKAPKLPVMPLAQKLIWANEIEEPMLSRSRGSSPVALLVGALISLFDLMALLVGAGYPDDLNQIKPLGSDGDYKFSKVTPKGWLCLETLVVHGESIPRRDPETKVEVVPPKSYLEYHDLSAMWIIGTKQHTPRDIAVAYPEGVPKPIRIYRVYKKTGERSTNVRLVFENLQARNKVLSLGKLKLWDRSHRVVSLANLSKAKPKSKTKNTPAGRRRRRQGRND